MEQTELAAVRNFRVADDRLCTAGQPSEDQLASAAAEGVRVVINLALHDDTRYSLKDERATVESLGMIYLHIPVRFSAPTELDLLQFFDAMEAHRSDHVLVHCAANYRVTAFLGLYLVVREGWAPDRAFGLMHTVWQPDEVWAQFIEAMLGKLWQQQVGE